jgi:dinuclear metal center YbgI/SA1388 family protein
MKTLKEFCKYLDELLPSQKIIDYCPNGLQIEGKEIITQAATAVSASLATIKEAVKQKVDLLIVHHGLFWQKDTYVIEGSKRKKIALLLENNISLIAYHLPLDMHKEIGNNWRAAKEMGWSNLQPFCLINGYPIGVKGEISPCSQNKFKKQLEKYYQHEAHSVCSGPDTIKTVGLVSGGAHRNIMDASLEGLDAFITGSFDEPTWHQADEERINFFALGHSATERIGPIALAEYINKTLLIPCSFIDIPNPF